MARLDSSIKKISKVGEAVKRNLLAAILLAIFLATSVNAHDLFLKFDNYFLQPNSRATVRVMNGDFGKSENAVARDRMLDVSIVAPSGKRLNPPSTDWRDEGTTALLDIHPQELGTYLVGLYTQPREIDLKAKQFNDYLAHDGLPDTFAERGRKKELNKDVRERYSKHVKAIFQVGNALTENFKTPLGYPVEIIPQQNPYSLKEGQPLEVLCIKDGQPLVDQFVMAGREANGRHIPAPSVRTNANGIARIVLKGAGKWYVKFIHMTPMNDAKINYESKWATLTFEIR